MTASSRGLDPGACGEALNLNVHLHSLVLDGVFTRPSPAAGSGVSGPAAPTDDDIAQLREQIHGRSARSSSSSTLSGLGLISCRSSKGGE